MKRATLRNSVEVPESVGDLGKVYTNAKNEGLYGDRLLAGTTVDILRDVGLQVLVRGVPVSAGALPVVVKAWRDNLTFIDPYVKSQHRPRHRADIATLLTSGATHVLVTDAADPYEYRAVLPRMSLKRTIEELKASEIGVHEIYSRRVDLYLQLLEPKAWHLD